LSPIQNASPEIISRAVKLLKSGSPVSFPTDTVFALGAAVDDEAAVARVYEIKQRPRNMALPILISSIEEIDAVAIHIPEAARALMRHFWPGALTLVLNKTDLVSDVVTAGGNTVAVRMANHPVAIEMVRRAGIPLVGTSANIHGKKSPVTAQEVVNQIGSEVELIIDSGQTPGGIESTIIDLSSKTVKILRQGAVKRSDLAQFCRIE
jgi:L-threonylcarbamoyladenylate synthase